LSRVFTDSSSRQVVSGLASLESLPTAPPHLNVSRVRSEGKEYLLRAAPATRYIARCELIECSAPCSCDHTHDSRDLSQAPLSRPRYTPRASTARTRCQMPSVLLLPRRSPSRRGNRDAEESTLLFRTVSGPLTAPVTKLYDSTPCTYCAIGGCRHGLAIAGVVVRSRGRGLPSRVAPGERPEEEDGLDLCHPGQARNQVRGDRHAESVGVGGESSGCEGKGFPVRIATLFRG